MTGSAFYFLMNFWIMKKAKRIRICKVPVTGFHLVTQEIILEADCVNTLYWQLLDTMQWFSSARKKKWGCCNAKRKHRGPLCCKMTQFSKYVDSKVKTLPSPAQPPAVWPGTVHWMTWENCFYFLVSSRSAPCIWAKPKNKTASSQWLQSFFFLLHVFSVL